MSELEPKYAELQSIYDISNEFFELFLGPTMGYTCSYFPREGLTLEEGQLAKFDLALGKLGLQPGMTLLDIGCGWGACMQRAIENYDVNVIGLTLSERQRDYAAAKLAEIGTERTVEVRLQGWEEFDEKVDRIVSIGAFEHFGHNRYDDFFEMAHTALPEDGVMLLHTITAITQADAKRLGVPITLEIARFAKFIATEIFPGGRLPTVPMVEEHAAKAGFTLTQEQAIGQYYPRTLEMWAAGLESHRDEAIAMQSQAVYDRYDKYLNGCPRLFREGHTNVHQFTLQK
ncbi:class I SAM-dependent methyltransferase [Mycobacterium sp. Y57]|uniref:cyclopropane mycolic acid synthase family methyltransferase n=1 Tax=Mycolicibacterium xanthum TaxID=2796469 RepID=UPI001C85E30C|nr:cyclopropane mycolic acid synthase family methyltransferase [Mycolicibacterium xanthum]MBX7431076.1 class I SAM-dependent methyltransferase [Mycolicibacterium xanthum]